MISKILTATIAVMLCNAIAYGEPPTAQYGAPFVDPNNNGYNNNHNNNNYNHNYDGGHHNYDDHSEPKAYEFGYQVKDDYTGTNYNRQESSDGNQVTGEYRVQLPDGRMQIVTYYADWQSGFHADVRYEGTAQYPDAYKTPNGGNGHQASGVSNQYGAPNYNNHNNNYDHNGLNGNYNSNNYNHNGGGGHGAASSSVSVNNLSGPGAPYNANGNNGYTYNNPNNNYNNNNY